MCRVESPIDGLRCVRVGVRVRVIIRISIRVRVMFSVRVRTMF